MDFTIPPDDREVGGPNPPGDMNDASDMLGLLAQALAQYSGYAAGTSIPADNAANVSAVETMVGLGLSGVAMTGTLGAAGGVAELDSDGFVPTGELPVSAISVFIVGTTVPSSALGLNGDAYWNIDSGDVYIKSSGSWTEIGSLPLDVPLSGLYLCTPTQYAPGSQTILSTPVSTTVAAGSNGGEISAVASWSSPSAGVLDVASTTGYPTGGGVLYVAASGSTTALVSYTGISGNSFTGCAYISGSATGTVATGGAVSLAMSAVSSADINTGSFTAPASGTVVVAATFAAVLQSNSYTCGFCLVEHGTSTIVGYSTVTKLPSGNAQPVSLEFIVTGLTASDSYNFDLAFAMGSGGDILSVYAFGQQQPAFLGAGSSGAPVTMTVQGV